jgi:aryl-alcohol dehydrogenase-like predicted oxidoreductase/enamine deaminase RidA (YjgF/YER057c/UK114 family)
MNIPRISLSNDISISPLINGLWQIADMERDDHTIDLNLAADSMAKYLKLGLTTFDMADHYGSAEVISGLFREKLANPNEVQLFTKWVPEPGPSSREKVRAAIERSLERMKSSSLDLLQYHAWNYADPAWWDDLFYLEELRQEGLIRHLGLTNFNAAHLNMILETGIPIVSNQICYSLLDQRATRQMTEVCQKHNVKILAFGTIAGGFFSEKWLGKSDPGIHENLTWSQMKYRRFIEESGGWESFQALLNILREIAQKHQVKIPHVASAYILSQPAVAGVIVGVRLGLDRYLEENLKILKVQLDEEDLIQINQHLVSQKPIPGDCGDEYRKPPFLTASGDLSHHLESFPPPYPKVEVSENRSKVLSGTIWEDLAGFSRAIRKGNRILVSGTTATHGNRCIGGSDPAAQTHFILDKIEGVLQSLGGKMKDVIRTRIYIQRMEDWEAVARVHGERFADIQPANTMIRVDLIGEEYLVEIEVEAEIDEC